MTEKSGRTEEPALCVCADFMNYIEVGAPALTLFYLVSRDSLDLKHMPRIIYNIAMKLEVYLSCE